jgi:iron complex outermembrane recepter protein
MKQLQLLIVAALLCIGATKAQQSFKITGQIKDVNNNAVAAATVMLHKATDSLLVKTAITNSSGAYELPALSPGVYFISITATGLEKNTTAVLEVKDNDLTVPAITLKPQDKSLAGVTVVSKKPMVEVRADRTIMNVEGTINATGNTAIELLRKAPGVIIDKDDKISMAGKNGVQIYIDGKPSPLTGADLAAYLKSIQSTQVEAIELITNPGAKYEAAGNAGIINIRLKKNKTLGTNGSVNAGYNIGVYSKYNGGLNLNHRTKKLNLFGSYNYNNAINVTEFTLKRTVLDTSFNQSSVIKQSNVTSGFKAGLDYFIDAKNTIGILVNGNINSGETFNYSRTPISYIPAATVNRLLVADNSTTSTRDNVNFNVNYRYNNGKGKELNVDADYGFFNLSNDQLQPNYYYNAAGTVETERAVYNFVSPSNIKIFAAKVDYEQNFLKGKLGVGGKVSVVSTNNHFERFNVLPARVLDVPRSNEFVYNENINALYTTYNRNLKGKVIQLGLRMENTVSEGDTYGLFANGKVDKNSKQSFRRNYTNLFPSGSITFNKNPMKQWTIAYSRRIDRPAYQDLNPFEFKLDEYTFQKGNTNLRPQYTNAISVTNVYKYVLTTSLSYSHVKDIFTQLIDTAEKSKSFITQKNLATQDIVSLNVSYPMQRKWYSMFVNLNSFYAHYKADLGGGNRTINLDVFTVALYMQHSFNLGKGWNAELSGFYNSPSVWAGTIKSKALWSMDAGLSKPILKKKGTIKASLTDVFRSLIWRGTSDFTGQSTTFRGYGETRQFRINFNYRFGNSQVKAARNRRSATEDENKRTKGGGGVIGGGGNN